MTHDERIAVPSEIGVVGLGAMGAGVATNLLSHGVRVRGYDVDVDARQRLAEQGGIPAESVGDLAAHVDTVLLSLPNGQAVVQTVGPDSGLLAGGRVRTVIDLSTCGSSAAETAAAAAREAGIDYVDCPVSGGPGGARNGTLTLMLAGERDVIERNRGLLELVGARLYILGNRPGQAQAAKVINNLLSAVSLLATAEALSVGVRAGLDPTALLEIINASSGRNTATADKFPKYVLTGTFDFGFQLAHMRKDVGLCLDAARALRVPMPLGTVAEQVWSIAERELPAGADCTAVAALVERWADVRIRSAAGAPEGEAHHAV